MLYDCFLVQDLLSSVKARLASTLRSSFVGLSLCLRCEYSQMPSKMMVMLPLESNTLRFLLLCWRLLLPHRDASSNFVRCQGPLPHASIRLSKPCMKKSLSFHPKVGVASANVPTFRALSSGSRHGRPVHHLSA